MKNLFVTLNLTCLHKTREKGFAMKIEKIVEGNKTEVLLDGRLDTNAAAEFAKEMETILTPDLKELVIDMQNCGYMASSGLRIVVNAQKTMDANQGTLVLRNVPGDVMEVFDMTGLADLLTFE